MPGSNDRIAQTNAAIAAVQRDIAALQERQSAAQTQRAAAQVPPSNAVFGEPYTPLHNPFVAPDLSGLAQQTFEPSTSAITQPTRVGSPSVAFRTGATQKGKTVGKPRGQPRGQPRQQANEGQNTHAPATSLGPIQNVLAERRRRRLGTRGRF